MSSTTTPTPSETARTAEAAIAAGILADGERFKPIYHFGLLISGMHPEARILGFALLWYARHTTGRISPAIQPTYQQLAIDTGLSAARVAVQIKVLQTRGWLHLGTVPNGPRRGKPRYELTIPQLYLDRVRAAREEREENQAARRARHQERTQAEDR